jgi:NAD(P)-dependent dehydrogenase (short-subunit alcohol dehydrogenase family)
MTDLSGRCCVVTGATNGIGRATAHALAEMGAAVVVHGRNAAAVDAVCRAIAEATRNARVTGAVADFGSLADVRRMAQDVASRHRHIDVLVNNAGTMSRVRRTTADGFEWQFGVNHLAPFLLTNLLLDPVKASAAGRVVNVASQAHRRATIDFDDLQLERKRYSGFRAYGASKLANILFTAELSRRLAGTNVTANCLHPGVVATNIFGGGAVGKLIGLLGRWVLLSPTEGAATSVYLASSAEVGGVTGKYFDKCREVAPARIASDAAAAARLWGISERLTGLKT